jgi:hypothetical protein
MVCRRCNPRSCCCRTVRIENVGAPIAFVSGDLFRLLIDGVPLAPTKAPISAMQFQAKLDVEVGFVMPGTATSAILQIGTLGVKPSRCRSIFQRRIEPDCTTGPRRAEL